MANFSGAWYNNRKTMEGRREGMKKVNTSLLGLFPTLRSRKTFEGTREEVKEFWIEVSLLSSLLA